MGARYDARKQEGERRIGGEEAESTAAAVE